jgi:hypothetical protein
VPEHGVSHADDSQSYTPSRSSTPLGFAFAQFCWQTSSPSAHVDSHSSRLMQLALPEQAESTEQHALVRHDSHAGIEEVSVPQLELPPLVSG